MRVIRKVAALSPNAPRKKRVAAYARVSVRKDENLRSLSAQVSYYSEYIQKRPEWEYAGVYADEAQTGTKDDRKEFQRLLVDCRAGKVDIILTKSITRFARNTVTMLETVRELKLLNVDVWFEKENIHSISGDGELMLTILASFAQEESLSNSENMKWRFRNRFKQGRPSTTVMYGYKLVNEEFIIVPEEAEAVRLIFAEFISGTKKADIARKLTDAGYRPKKGGAWSISTIHFILINEKYAGVLLLQKQFRENHITKKVVRNCGELPMYRVENNHEPIVGMEIFNKAQELLAAYSPKQGRVKWDDSQRENAIHNNPVRRKYQRYPYSGKIVCGQCGRYYVRSVNRAGTPSEVVSWVCGTYASQGKAACPAESIPERILDGIGYEFTRVVIQKPETLIITKPDGTEVTMPWHRRTCKDAWTPEKRQQASEKAIAGWERRQAECKQQPKE
jgi:DNA invertase Pin-like site-specific DNA recombinase